MKICLYFFGLLIQNFLLIWKLKKKINTKLRIDLLKNLMKSLSFYLKYLNLPHDTVVNFTSLQINNAYEQKLYLNRNKRIPFENNSSNNFSLLPIHQRTTEHQHFSSFKFKFHSNRSFLFLLKKTKTLF